MNKKGFTLIELLAVIVILAIIALIATPIVLNIIKDSKDSATLQSAQFYIGAVETAITKKIIDDPTFKPSICEIQVDGNIKCDGKEEIIKVEVSGEVPSSGTITLENGKITGVSLVLSEKTIVKNNEGKLVYGKATPKEKTLDDICDYDETSTVSEQTAGARYKCKVKEVMEEDFTDGYIFYVLSYNDSEGKTTDDKTKAEYINLILERNVCDDGTLTNSTKEDKCLVAWKTSGENVYGPVTAMDYLYNATKDWTNIPNIEMNYSDEGNTGSFGYGTIITTDNITKITKKDGTAVTVLIEQEGYSNLKTRLPYKSEVSNYDITDKTNAYLYDYLDQYNDIRTNPISLIQGYWTLSSYGSSSAWYVNYWQGIYDAYANKNNGIGVRPVITLKM